MIVPNQYDHIKSTVLKVSLRCLSFDHLATNTGAIIVPSCGLDSVPSDLLVLLSNKTLKDTFGSEATIAHSQTFFRLTGGGISGGTLATFFTHLRDVPTSLARAARADYCLSFGGSFRLLRAEKSD